MNGYVSAVRVASRGDHRKKVIQARKQRRVFCPVGICETPEIKIKVRRSAFQSRNLRHRVSGSVLLQLQLRLLGSVRGL